MIQTYNEFKVIYSGSEIINKEKTARGTVRIDEFTASVNNSYSKSTGLVYEVVPEKAKKGRPAKDK